ncbi:protein of unknown function [Vibrio tapetis subsp. tapetis]|uniref:Uncharacterized protein n=1 Tax=Vibrio tapetis subsp. tapetis TaxID=1671868 RepID=A0A2N8ZAB6_9VIBR|nr:protein of unknown function [Vibrio tapetis subsp. tapetis]
MRFISYLSEYESRMSHMFNLILIIGCGNYVGEFFKVPIWSLLIIVIFQLNTFFINGFVRIYT